ncbi:hypothetical protein [Serinicoccus chungangensis]|uniref:hypothetical protein n=1 Tax=Serinicoccus chungangensis TaxID=767452 RepID=UPI001F16FB7A|nr:hypothetical protein [Serinicoccus chungangensis]
MTMGSAAGWGLRWLAWELVGKITIGLLVGVAVGWVMAYLAFRTRQQALRLAEQGESLLALAAMLLAYGWPRSPRATASSRSSSAR